MASITNNSTYLHISDGDLHLNTRFDAHTSNLFHHLCGGVQINEPLVDTHLETIPGLRPFTAGRFTCRDGKCFRRQSYRSLYQQLLLFGTTDEFRTNFFQTLHVAACEGYTNSMDSCFLLGHL